MQMIRGAAALAAGVLMVGGLAACGDEGEPEESSSTASPSEVEPSSSSDSSDSGSSSSSSGSSETQGEGKVAELPKAAKKRTKAGAIAFNEFYFVESGEALRTGRAETLDALSDKCSVCDSFVESVRADAKKGVQMNRNPYSVTKTSAAKRDDGGFRVEVTLKVTEYSEVLKDGSKGRTAEPMSMQVVTDTQWVNGQWTMRDQVRVK